MIDPAGTSGMTCMVDMRREMSSWFAFVRTIICPGGRVWPLAMIGEMAFTEF